MLLLKLVVGDGGMHSWLSSSDSINPPHYNCVSSCRAIPVPLCCVTAHYAAWVSTGTCKYHAAQVHGISRGAGDGDKSQICSFYTYFCPERGIEYIHTSHNHSS